MIFILLYSFFFIVYLYLLYVQFHPKIGNIWFRNNSYFSPIGALKIIFFPLVCCQMWKISFWDMNIFIWFLFFTAIVALCFSFFIFFCMRSMV